MSVTTKRYASFELSGAAVTGLSPTITIKDTRKDSVIVSSATMTEDSDISGTYYYQFSGAEGHEYIQRVDAGTDSVDNRYQTSAFTLADEDALAKSHLVARGQGTVANFTEEQLDTIVSRIIERIPEFPDIIPILEKKMDEKVVRVELPSFDPVMEKLDEFIKLSRASSDNISSDIAKSLEELGGAIKNEVTQLSDDFRDIKDVSSEAVRSLKSTTIISDRINNTIKVFMDNVSVDLIDFLAAMEAKKQEALGNAKLRDAALDTFKQFKSFKSKK